MTGFYLNLRPLMLPLLLGMMAVTALSQVSPLEIKGSVTSVTVREKLLIRDGEYVLDKNTHRPVRELVYYSINLRLTYSNRGNDTIIVPTPEFFRAAERKIRFLDLPSSDAKVALSVDDFDVYGELDRGRVRSRKEALEALNAPIPIPNYFVAIPPGESRELGATIPVKDGYKLDTVNGVLQYGGDLEFAAPLHKYFKLQFSSPLFEGPGVSAPVEARDRWRKLGRLLVDSGGGFSLESEVIINKLADIH